MSIEATADALAADTAAPQQEAPEAEVSMEAELSALYDKMTETPEQDAPEVEEVADAEPVEEFAEVEEDQGEPEEVEAPSGLPAELRQLWGKMAPEARDAVMKDREGLHRKLSEMGRQVQGISPIRDSLVEAAQKFPFLAEMKPQDVAQQVFQLAGIGQELKQNPGAVLARLAKQYNAEQALVQSLQGQEVAPESHSLREALNKVEILERRLAQVSDPEYLDQRISQATAQQTIMSEVTQFAQSAEHWALLEPHMPHFIAEAKETLGDSAAPRAVLEAAHKKAIEKLLPAQASFQPAEEAHADPDPDRTAKALKAKSVNVSSKATGKPRPLSEAEELSLIYDKASKR